MEVFGGMAAHTRSFFGILPSCGMLASSPTRSQPPHLLCPSHRTTSSLSNSMALYSVVARKILVSAEYGSPILPHVGCLQISEHPRASMQQS
eukprot:256414-Pleurochrysis_carterae.AAC.1